MKKLHSIFSVPNKKLLVKSFFQCQEKEQEIYLEVITNKYISGGSVDFAKEAELIFGK